MKRRWTITLILSLAALAGLLLAKYWPRTIDDNDCSNLYRLYAGHQGIDATFISQMHLNDSLRIDLTLLQATDSNGWLQLVSDFNIPPLSPDEVSLLANGNPEILLSILSTPPSDTLHIAAVSRQLHCVSIFHVTSQDQFNTIIDNHIDQLNQMTL